MYRFDLEDEVCIAVPAPNDEQQKVLYEENMRGRVKRRAPYSKDPSKNTYKIEFINGLTIYLLEDRLKKYGEAATYMQMNCCPKCGTPLKELFISKYCPKCD